MYIWFYFLLLLCSYTNIQRKKILFIIECFVAKFLPSFSWHFRKITNKIKNWYLSSSSSSNWLVSSQMFSFHRCSSLSMTNLPVYIDSNISFVTISIHQLDLWLQILPYRLNVLNFPLIPLSRIWSVINVYKELNLGCFHHPFLFLTHNLILWTIHQYRYHDRIFIQWLFKGME